MCLIKSLYTEAINHDPAITFFQTGSSIAGRPSMGSWLSYGLGSANQNLPTFCVLISHKRPDQPLYSRLWGNGFLPSVHQGVQFRAGADPVLYLENPPGVSAAGRRKMLDRLRELHQIEYDTVLDPAIQARIAQYEMAYRMQTSVPEVTRLSDEPESCLRAIRARLAARREPSRPTACWPAGLAERDVRFIQLYHPGWDHHGGLPGGIRQQCRETDQACAALIQDLKQRGMLDDTLVLWGGEFGRTNYSQGKLTATDYGRDHHPRCFTVWAAGGGIKPGITYGATDPFGYSVATDGVHVNDFHATILYLLGIDHERLTYKHQGRYYRLTDVSARWSRRSSPERFHRGFADPSKSGEFLPEIGAVGRRREGDRQKGTWPQIGGRVVRPAGPSPRRRAAAGSGRTACGSEPEVVRPRLSVGVAPRPSPIVRP